VRRWFLLGLSACSFQHGTLNGGGTGSGDDATPGDDAEVVVDAISVDAPPDAACLAKWRAGPTFTTPAMLFGVATTGDEADPFLTADEKTIYFVRSSDIYKGTRASLSTTTFSNVAKASDLSSGAGDSKVSITADGMTAFLNSSRTGGSGMSDVWRATRTSVTATFETPDQKYLVSVNTGGDQWDPHVSANGLRLYIAPPASPMQHIEMASRASLSDDFGAPVALTALDSGERDNDPTLTADERLIVFASNRNGNRNLWYALRDDPTQPFGAPIVVPQINTNTDDGPHLSHDGCRLYFTSDRDSDIDVWVTEVQ
jgi:Tol biopolymer transport system component